MHVLGPALLANYKALVSVGHDEYYGAAQRKALETFVGAGGHLAFFGGNQMLWKANYDPNDRILACAKQI